MGTTIKTLADVLATAQVEGANFVQVSREAASRRKSLHVEFAKAAARAAVFGLPLRSRGMAVEAAFSISVDERAEYEDVQVSAVSESDDPEAWRLAREALQAEPSSVWVGARDFPGDAGAYQTVYAY
jgi:hypothetical protein